MQLFTGRRETPPTTVAWALGVPTAAALSASSATMTVQAPQSPSAQPSLVPVQWARSRSQSSTLSVGSASFTLTTWPRCTKRIGRVWDMGVFLDLRIARRYRGAGTIAIWRHA